jgi:hypothetical protein
MMYRCSLDTVNSLELINRLTFNGRSAPIGAAMSKVEMGEVHQFVHVAI